MSSEQKEIKKDKKIKEKKVDHKKNEKKEKGVSLGMENKKDKNFSEWYREILIKAELIEYYDVSGCYIFRPWSYRIWELIQQYMDNEF